MKKLWKRMNRGLLLGALLIVILSCYLIYDNMQFKKETKGLEQKVEQYMGDYTDAFMCGEILKKSRDSWTEEDRKQLEENMKNVVNKYWTDTVPNSNVYGNTKQNILGEIQLFMEEDTKGQNGYVTDLQYQITKLKVKKAGPAVAKVTFNCQSTERFKGSCPYFGFDYYQGYVMYSENEDFSDKNICRDANYQVTMEMKKTDGEWKISAISAFYDSYPEPYIEE